MNRWSYILLIFCFFSLAGCSPFYRTIVVSSYAEKEIQFENVGSSKDQWILEPLIVIEDQLALNIRAAAWKSITPVGEFCPRPNSMFFFRFWTNKNIEIQVKNTFFTNKFGKKIGINNVRKSSLSSLVYSRVSPSDKTITILKSNITLENIKKLWKAENDKNLNMGKNYFEFETDSFVGCADEKYKFTLSFNNLDTGKGFEKTLYFYPLTYETISR